MFERKYEIQDGKIIKRSDGSSIPDDEPVFIFRAKDIRALAALVAYSVTLDSKEHKESVKDCIQDFRNFAAENPDKMSEPTP